MKISNRIRASVQVCSIITPGRFAQRPKVFSLTTKAIVSGFGCLLLFGVTGPVNGLHAQQFKPDKVASKQEKAKVSQNNSSSSYDLPNQSPLIKRIALQPVRLGRSGLRVFLGVTSPKSSDSPIGQITFEQAVRVSVPEVGEGDMRIRLRLHNNSGSPIILDMSGVPSKDYGDALLSYDVLLDREPIIQRQCHVCSRNALGPGKSLVFSVPQGYLSSGRAIRVRFGLGSADLNEVTGNEENEQYVYFSSSQLPRAINQDLKDSVRKAVDLPFPKAANESREQLLHFGPPATPFIAEAIRSDSKMNPIKKAFLVDVIVRITGEESVSALITLLSDDDPLLRGLGADSLGKRRSRSAIPNLIRLLSDHGVYKTVAYTDPASEHAVLVRDVAIESLQAVTGTILAPQGSEEQQAQGVGVR